MKRLIESCVGVRVRLREKLLVVRGPSGMEFNVAWDEIDESTEIQYPRDTSTLITKRSFAEQAGLPPTPEPEPAAEETAHEEETTMAYQQKDMSGALFKNTDKKGDKSPDYTGSVMIGGQVYYLSAWIKTSQAGTKYMSLSFKLKDDQRQGASARRHDDSDIRF